MTVFHHQDILNTELRLSGEYGVRPWLAIGAVVPLRIFKTSIRYADENGQTVAIDNPFIHHHNETLVGPSDPSLIARAATRAGGVTFGARLGLSFPLGRTEEDPFALGDLGQAHEHSQFGTGTFQPIAGIDLSRSFGPVRVDAFALTVQSLYENGHGFQPGDRYAAGIGGASALGTKLWRFRLTVEAQHETAETWGGVIHTDEGNLGRTDVLTGLETTFRLTDDWHVGATLKVPVYTHVQGGQLDASVFVGLSVGTSIHLLEEDDEHHHEGEDHDHAHETGPVDWTGLDKLDITNDGSAVPLEPVPGKITVFDFWATWCKPCGIVDRELSELARRHPGDIAVRKVNVVDDESPASKKYIGASTLPHLKVFGRDGKLLWERSAPPLVLIGEVEKLLSTPPRPAAVTGARRIEISVTDGGFVPAQIEVARGEPVTLVFIRRSQATCSTDVHMTLPGGAKIHELLPFEQPVEVPFRVDAPTSVEFACGMEMDRGTIVVK
jgi:thiol-disulfide isomerase/thioredoxin